MLPAYRTAGEPFAIPQFALTRSDLDTFMDELRGFHTAFRACFARQEPRDQFFNYMVGQFSTLERKSIEPMALQVEGGKVRAMQRLVSDALWDEDAMRETYHRLVSSAGITQRVALVAARRISRAVSFSCTSSVSVADDN
jgi:DDE superfamily endonuclease